jgi:hypothetical protein
MAASRLAGKAAAGSAGPPAGRNPSLGEILKSGQGRSWTRMFVLGLIVLVAVTFFGRVSPAVGGSLTRGPGDAIAQLELVLLLLCR